MNIVRKAFMLALEAHKHQMYGDRPYIVHLFDVVAVLYEFGLGNQTVVAAAWLHDLIEDTSFNYHNVKLACGGEVAEIVLAVTDEIGRNRIERKDKTLPKIEGYYDATVVKLTDWVANVRDAHRTGSDLLQMYKKEYADFKCQCHDPDQELDILWNELDSLMEE